MRSYVLSSQAWLSAPPVSISTYMLCKLVWYVSLILNYIVAQMYCAVDENDVH
jgi:hypothetical protein